MPSARVIINLSRFTLPEGAPKVLTKSAWSITGRDPAGADGALDGLALHLDPAVSGIDVQDRGL